MNKRRFERRTITLNALTWLCAVSSVANAQMPQPVSATQATPSQQAKASVGVTGSVADSDGQLIQGAQVMLTGVGAPQNISTDSDGRFRFSVTPSPSIRLRLIVTAQGRAPATVNGTLSSAEGFDAGTVVLHASADLTIEALSPHGVAEIEVKFEEHQRVLGFAPNFYVAYDFNAPPLDARQKWELNWRTLADPINIALLAGQAGIEQATGSFSGFGSGAAGYGKRLGAASADFAIGNSLAGWVLPVVFKQDPRYFYMGTGTKRHRFLYAVSRAVIARSDKGKSQPAYANVLGSLGAGAASNLYYPAENRQGATLTFENTGLSIGFNAISNVLQEFFLKHISTGVKQP